jgi:hypothetical protein
MVRVIEDTITNRAIRHAYGWPRIEARLEPALVKSRPSDRDEPNSGGESGDGPGDDSGSASNSGSKRSGGTGMLQFNDKKGLVSKEIGRAHV